MKIFIKILCLYGLLCFGLIVLIGCAGNKDCPESSQSISKNEVTETVEDESQISVKPDSPNNSLQTRCDNYFFGPGDFPRDGQTAITQLAQAIINTSAEDEVMYFLIYMNDSRNSVDLYPEVPFYYEGESVLNIQANYESANVNRYNYYQSLKKSGMSEEDIAADPEYIKLDKAADELFKQLTYARSARFYDVNKETVLQYIGYFEELGFEQLGDINDIAWQRRMTISGGAARMPIMFGVSGTLDDLERLCEDNDKYGIIFFASDSEGHWIERNDNPDDRRENTFFLYEIPELYIGQVYYSYQELGIYERIWKVN
jgi:hypothetical protein